MSNSRCVRFVPQASRCLLFAPRCLRALPLIAAAPFAAHVYAASDQPMDDQQTPQLETVTATANAINIPASAANAPSQNSLTARSAQSIVGEKFIEDYISPNADFSQVFQMTPGVFSYSPNGPGLGDTKTYFRGFQDGDYTIAFDGIPFQDTNSPTHHSWAFFPSQFLGGAVVDRSPGTAAMVGPTNFGGSINLLSRNFDPQPHNSVSASYGTWNTTLVNGELQTGAFGPGGSSNLIVNAHAMNSDGYQTFNDQQRQGISVKYQFAVSENTTLTAFGSRIDLQANTPNTKGPTRAQVAQYGDNYLLSGDPSQPNYYGYNAYHVTSDFEYLGLVSNLGNGWKLDDKLYTYYYHNKQFYNGSTITKTSATDKLNAYRTNGNILRLTQESSFGTFRTGLWSEWPNTYRYQIPSDPRTHIDASLPNFRESYNTKTSQPFAEYEFNVTSDLHITPGIKYSSYEQRFTQYADNGKTVGSLGGAPFIKHTADYDTWLPSLDVHYFLDRHWSVYAQYATGDEIPPTNVFDVKNANVTVQPKPVKNKTFQVGTVWQSERLSVSADAYDIKFDNAYSSFTDNDGNTTWYSNGKSVAKGVEAEANLIVGWGFSVYANATLSSMKYDDGPSQGQWVANAPDNTETLGINYEDGPWNIGGYAKRVGRLYNDNGATHEAVKIDPFVITNLFINYTIDHSPIWPRPMKVQLGFNNLFNQHSIVGVNPASTKTSVAAPGDVLTLLAERSVSLAVKADF